MREKQVTTAFIILTLLISTAVLVSPVRAPGDPDERFKGYNLEQSKWTTGNLGKDYVEGNFVSYLLRISSDSKVWGLDSFNISYNFHQDSSDAVYIDGFDTSGNDTYAMTGFQYAFDVPYLSDSEMWPPSPGWTHIYVPAANDAGPLGEAYIGNYMDAWPPGVSETDDDPADERYFTVYDIAWPDASTEDHHMFLFFRAHLALSIIWLNGLEYDLPTELDGDVFDGWDAVHNGASFATGSSRHFYLQVPGIGAKTIPIPIAQYPNTVINGHKYVDEVLFDGWNITLHGDLELFDSLTIPYDPPSVFTGTTPWTQGYFEFSGLISGRYNVLEEDRPSQGIIHDDIIVSGDAENTVINVLAGWAEFDLDEGETATVDFYNIQPSTIEGYKHEDLDGDGDQDIPIDGWNVDLYIWNDTQGAYVYNRSALTGTDEWPDGYYNFTDLRPGSYRVDEEDRAGWTHTSPAQQLHELPECQRDCLEV